MSDENRFFRFVWRFNAILLAAVVFVVLVSLGWGLFSLLSISRVYSPEPVGHFAPVPKAAEQHYTFRLANSQLQTSLANEKVLTLQRWPADQNEYDLSIGSGPSSSRMAQDVNLLAVDRQDANSHWLFHGYDRLIVSQDPVNATQPPDSKGTPPVIALVIQSVDADTNKDGELTYKDRQSLYFYDQGTSEAVKFLTADDIIVTEQIEGGKYLVVYENGKVATAATYSIPDFKLLTQKPLPNVPN